jgi:hypothetical protein
LSNRIVEDRAFVFSASNNSKGMDTVTKGPFFLKNYKITLSQLVDWAVTVMNEGALDPNEGPVLRHVMARLGVADVKAFGLTWEGCYDFLSKLGCRVEVQAA